ncbi:unnamed protein product [Amoebophrya sp. A120]|nr:unnamed protein product [Amoebophrya sp. A120]|eukprot:GSA120T00003442001.1
MWSSSSSVQSCSRGRTGSRRTSTLFRVLLGLGAVAAPHGGPSVVSAQETSALKKMQQLRDESSDGVIRFDSLQEYKSLVAGRPDDEQHTVKNYHVILLFTLPEGSSPKSCPACGPFLEVMRRVAPSYLEKPVFFVLVPMGPISQLHSIMRLPQFAHIGTTYSGTYDEGKNAKPYTLQRLWPGSDEPSKFLHWVNSATGEQAQLVRTLGDQLTSLVLLLSFFSFVAVVGQAALKLLQRFPEIMAAGSLVIAALGMSGIMYNIINQKMNFFGITQAGTFELILPSSRAQHLGEGMLFGVCFVLTGSGFAFLARTRSTINVYLPSPRRREELAQRTRQTLMVLSACVFIMYFVESSYKQKSGWHMATPFFPPSHFKRGPVTVDQGTSF